MIDYNIMAEKSDGNIESVCSMFAMDGCAMNDLSEIIPKEIVRQPKVINEGKQLITNYRWKAANTRLSQVNKSLTEGPMNRRRTLYE